MRGIIWILYELVMWASRRRDSLFNYVSSDKKAIQRQKTWTFWFGWLFVRLNGWRNWLSNKDFYLTMKGTKSPVSGKIILDAAAVNYPTPRTPEQVTESIKQDDKRKEIRSKTENDRQNW